MKSLSILSLTEKKLPEQEKKSSACLKIKLSLEQLKVTLALGSTESIVTAVSEGRGVSIISSIAAKKACAAGLVKIVKIKEAKTPRKLYIVRPKGPLVKISEAFWEFCKGYKFKNEVITCPAD